MLFYSVVIVTWAATSLATPPPGYVKEPDNDKDPPAYEYKYEIGDGNGKGQGKAETRTGEFASGNYYVNTGQATTDVKYFADDWGYHPVVKYGSTDKHSSTTARFALGEHAVKALRDGGDVGPEVKLPHESEKRKQVQIIQPYTIGDKDPSDVTPTYPNIVSDGRDAAKVDEAVENSREYSSSGENFPKESQGSSNVLIPSSSHSTTSQEIAYTASTPPTPLAYAPLQEVRDIYANNDYQNAALIDEQLYLQSAAGNFGQKVHTVSTGESGIKNFQFSTTTARPEVNSPPYFLTKQNGDVTYTVHSGSNANTAYLSSSGKSKKVQRLQDRYRYRQEFISSTTTESPNYSGNTLSAVIFPSTTSAPATPSREFTSNDLVSENQEKYEYVSLGAKPSQEFSEFGPADPRLVNYGLAPGNEEHNRHQEKLETPGLSTYGSGNKLQNENEVKSSTLNAYSAISSTISSASFAKPIVVAEVTPECDQPETGTACKCADDLLAPTTPAPVFSTTFQPIISTNTIVVTPKYPNQNHITTSSVILNPIQAGVTLVHAGETHLISQGGEKSSIPVKENVFEGSVSTIDNSVAIEKSHERNEELNLEERIRQVQEQQRVHENRIHEEEQHEKVKQLQEEIQFQQAQQFQQELQLQQNQYEIQGLRLEQQLQLEALQQQHTLQENAEKEIHEQQKYDYQQLGDSAALQQEVELQQVEESQQSEQLQYQHQQQEMEIQQVHKSQLQDVHIDQEQQQEDLNLQRVREEAESQARDFVTRNKIQEEIEQQKVQQLHQQRQQLEKYQQDQERHQTSNSFVTGSLGSAHHDSDIEIQKSIEIYHHEPVQEIHYPAQVPPAQVESLKIDQSQGQQQYIEVQSVENTQQGYKGQVDQSEGKVSSDINQVINDQVYNQLSQTKDQSSLAAENHAQQVLLVDHQANLNQAYDFTQSNSLSQQSAISNAGVLVGFGIDHENGGRHNYQIDQHRELGIGVHGIDQSPIPQRLIFGSNIAGGGYHLNQRDQSHSHSNTHSYESNHGQQQVVVGLPYTLEASKELVIPGIQTSSIQIVRNPIFEKHAGFEGTNGGEKYSVESSNESSIGRFVEKHIPAIQPYPVEKVIEKTVHVPQPYPVEKIIEKKVPYPVDRIVEKHIPILQPYPVHIKVPQPYPVEKIIPKPYPIETIVEKPIHIHVPVEKIVEKKIPVPQPYPVEVEKIVEKKVPYPVEVTKYIDKPIPIHVPKPYPVEKIVERIVEKPVHIRVPYAVEVVRNIPYGVQYGVSYQQIMRPRSHNLYIHQGKTRTPFYGLPVNTRHQEFRHQENGHGIVDSNVVQFQGYSYDKPSISFTDGGNANDQITAGNQQIQFEHSNSFSFGKKSNSHVVFPHYSSRRHTVRAKGQDKQRNEEYIGPVPPQRSLSLRHHQHSQQNQHGVQIRSPQSSTAATRSPAPSTTTFRRARELETKPQSGVGNFRQSRVEYGFKPPMIPSVQYDEKTASKVES